METRKDFIEREIQKIIKLIEKILNANTSNFDFEFQKVNEDLKEQIDVSIDDIVELSENDFLQKMESLDFSYLDNLIKLLYEIHKRIDKNKSELAKKIVQVINYTEEKSPIFSLERQQIKDNLKIDS